VFFCVEFYFSGGILFLRLAFDGRPLAHSMMLLYRFFFFFFFFFFFLFFFFFFFLNALGCQTVFFSPEYRHLSFGLRLFFSPLEFCRPWALRRGKVSLATVAPSVSTRNLLALYWLFCPPLLGLSTPFDPFLFQPFLPDGISSVL